MSRPLCVILFLLWSCCALPQTSTLNGPFKLSLTGFDFQERVKRKLSVSTRSLNVKQICDVFIGLESGKDLELLCHSMMIHSIRNLMISDVRTLRYELLPKYSNSLLLQMQDDCVSFSASYFYENLSPQKSSADQVACLFGPFSAKLVLLLMMRFPRLRIFSLLAHYLSPDESASVETVVSFAIQEGRRFVAVRGGPKRWKDALKGISCHFIHIRDSNLNLTPILSAFSGNRPNKPISSSDSMSSSSVVIWERMSHPATTNYSEYRSQRLQDYSDLVDWRYSFVWPVDTGIFIRKDPHGYNLEFYDASYAEASKLMETWMGIFPLGESEGIKSMKTCHRNAKHDWLILVTFMNQIFFGNALGMKAALESLDLVDVVVFGDFLLADLTELFLEEERGPSLHCRVLQIVIGFHEASLLLPRYVAVDVEQVWSIFMAMPMHDAILRDASAVFVMSAKHAEKLKKIPGLNMSKVYAMPLYTKSPAVTTTEAAGHPRSYGVYIHEFVNATANSEGELVRTELKESKFSPLGNIDIFFFGVCSDLRWEFSDYLLGRSAALSRRGMHRPLDIVVRCVTTWPDAVVDEERDALVQRAKVVVNVHNLPESSLEIHRINYLLSLGKCIVSEPSGYDPELDEKYRDGVIYAEGHDQIVDTLFELVRDPMILRRCETQARVFYRSLEQETDVLESALREIMAEQTYR